MRYTLANKDECLTIHIVGVWSHCRRSRVDGQSREEGVHSCSRGRGPCSPCSTFIQVSSRVDEKKTVTGSSPDECIPVQSRQISESTHIMLQTPKRTSQNPAYREHQRVISNERRKIATDCPRLWTRYPYRQLRVKANKCQRADRMWRGERRVLDGRLSMVTIDNRLRDGTSSLPM